jgi:hypothetical protein
LVINVGHAPGDRRLIDGLATTLRTIYSSIFVMDVPDTFNSLIYATLQETSVSNLEENLARLAGYQVANGLLVDSMVKTLNNLQPSPRETIVFTDDRSPVEWITNTMILNFLLQGEMENLQ